MLRTAPGRLASCACAVLSFALTTTAWSIPLQAPADDPMQPAPAPAAAPTPATAPAQDEPQPPPADPMTMDAPAAGAPTAPAPASSNNLLRGPDVPDTTARTLIRLDAQGRFQRVEGRPDEAALIILDLDPDTREQARQAAAARRETLRAALLQNLDLIIEGTDALEAGDREKATSLMRQMWDRIDPAHARDPVLIAISPILAADQRDDLARLVNDYWTSFIDWELRNAKDKSDAARQRIEDRISFELFQQEFRQAYDRTLRPYRQKMEVLVSAAQPTDEQKAAIRAILLDLIRLGGTEPTPEQLQETARRIYQSLDEERRQKLFEAAFNRL